ncbi:LysR family transcriptional regulator [Paraburkholderia sp. LEh10]|uniref:LysR substrate-binding domain-containing protein n=1 Tax=Paraburkholderia sp. LEh10 TaxID=2821353 RepID=UPI001AE4824B|nr:LysR substrate-binding domain-containing protein [Paraburkholderia sp. LEh10]MBP0590063.1 LysR family transcriptional regulator [Paraburkholderia sp. LEh10]
MSRMPPLKALVAFEAAMRLNSFSLAAEELGVTPGAVGQQVQKLEAWLGLALFSRQIRRIVPSDEARAYYAQIQPALAQIGHASRRMRENQSKGVRLSMPPSFAAKWFAPRMTSFLIAHPGIALELNTTTAFVDFELQSVDLAVRYFDGNAPDLQVQLLHPDEARVYCSPSYARRAKLRSPDDLQHATLLHNTLHPHWSMWLRKFSTLSARQVDGIAGIHFDQSLMAIEAAARGEGVVLTSAVLTEAERAAKSLVEPFDFALPLKTAYYLVHPKSVDLKAGAATLKAWLTGAS